jgi:hypothetical protein
VARDVWDVPAKKLSGLVYNPGQERILAVGDTVASLLRAPWLGDRPGEWTEIDLTAVGVPAEDSPLEAVGIGPDGSVVVATEAPAALFVLDGDGGGRRRIDLSARRSDRSDRRQLEHRGLGHVVQ